MLDLSTIRTVLFDMDGVIYRGSLRLPGVRELVSFCEAHQIATACITNNASKTPEQFEKKLQKMEIAIPKEHVLSSAQVTGHYLRNHYPKNTTAYVIGMKGLQQAMFRDGHFVEQEDHPELVVMGVDLEITYDKLKIGCLAIGAGAKFIATNLDPAFPAEDGFWPGAGALIAALQVATGVEPFVIGKPQPTLFETAIEMLNATPATTLVVGDRLETDIIGAQRAGAKSAVVLTGATSRELLAESDIQPDAVYDGLPELLSAWKEQIAHVAS
jgi:4-nitrophenyl phosphatase